MAVAAIHSRYCHPQPELAERDSKTCPGLGHRLVDRDGVKGQDAGQCRQTSVAARHVLGARTPARSSPIVMTETARRSGSRSTRAARPDSAAMKRDVSASPVVTEWEGRRWCLGSARGGRAERRVGPSCQQVATTCSGNEAWPPSGRLECRHWAPVHRDRDRFPGLDPFEQGTCVVAQVRDATSVMRRM